MSQTFGSALIVAVALDPRTISPRDREGHEGLVNEKKYFFLRALRPSFEK